MSLIVAYHSPNNSPSTTSCVLRSVLGRSCRGLRAIHQRCSNSLPYNPLTIRSNCVYRLSTEGVAFDTYQHQNPHAVHIYRKVCLKIGRLASQQSSHRMCQSMKLSFKIIFINFNHLENILESGLPLWFYKNHFPFKNYFFNFHIFS